MEHAYGNADELVEASITIVRHELMDSDPIMQDLKKFTSVFSVGLGSPSAHISACRRRFKDSLFVFKKKKLSSRVFEKHTDIYASSLQGLELDSLNQNKARTSCSRCRRYKRKCTRDLPECMNCSVSDELCTYEPRKNRRPSVSAIDSISPQSSAVRSMILGPSMYSIHGQTGELPVSETAYPRGTGLVETMAPESQKLRDSALQVKGGRSTSDLMRLLN